MTLQVVLSESAPEVLRSSSPRSSPAEDTPVPQWRVVWVRCGRGGVLYVDRRTTRWYPPCDELLSYPRCLTRSTTADSEAPEPEEAPTTEKEVSWHIRDLLFDADNEPSVGPYGPDEKGRVLVDEFHPRYALLCSQDLSSLTALLYLRSPFPKKVILLPRNIISFSGIVLFVLPQSCLLVSLLFLLFGTPATSKVFHQHSWPTPTAILTPDYHSTG